MIAFEGLAGFALVCLWIFCILDCIATDQMLIRNLPKGVWLLIVIVLPEVGSIAWLLLGRPSGASFGGAGRTYVPPIERQPRHQLPGKPARGPDDDPGYLRGIEERRLRAWEDDLRRREQQLRPKDDDEGE